jgi:hypothetical protein
MTLAKPFINDLREVASDAERIFETSLREKYPRADRFVWFKACELERKGAADKFDRDMANDPQIKRAYDAYIDALHTFYRARDGEGGVLGGRGL